MTLIADGSQSGRVIGCSFALEVHMMYFQFYRGPILTDSTCLFPAALTLIIVSGKDIGFDVFGFIHGVPLIHFSTNAWIHHVLDIKPPNFNPNYRFGRQCLLVSPDQGYAGPALTGWTAEAILLLWKKKRYLPVSSNVSDVSGK